MSKRVKAEPMTKGDVVEINFGHVMKVLDPLTKGDGEDEAVEAARLAVSALRVLTVYARRGGVLKEDLT